MSKLWKLLASPVAIRVAVVVLTAVVETLSRKVNASQYPYEQW